MHFMKDFVLIFLLLRFLLNNLSSLRLFS